MLVHPPRATGTVTRSAEPSPVGPYICIVAPYRTNNNVAPGHNAPNCSYGSYGDPHVLNDGEFLFLIPPNEPPAYYGASGGTIFG